MRPLAEHSRHPVTIGEEEVKSMVKYMEGLEASFPTIEKRPLSILRELNDVKTWIIKNAQLIRA